MRKNFILVTTNLDPPHDDLRIPAFISYEASLRKSCEIEEVMLSLTWNANKFGLIGVVHLLHRLRFISG